MKETIKIEGMSCGKCAERVNKAVQAVEGVQGVTVRLQEKSAEVEVEGEETLRQVYQAIRNTGYSPQTS